MNFIKKLLLKLGIVKEKPQVVEVEKHKEKKEFTKTKDGKIKYPKKKKPTPATISKIETVENKEIEEEYRWGKDMFRMTEHARERWVERRMPASSKDFLEILEDSCTPLQDKTLRYFLEYLEERHEELAEMFGSPETADETCAVYAQGYIAIIALGKNGGKHKVITLFYYYPWYAEQQMYTYYGYDIVKEGRR